MNVRDLIEMFAAVWIASILMGVVGVTSPGLHVVGIIVVVFWVAFNQGERDRQAR